MDFVKLFVVPLFVCYCTIITQMYDQNFYKFRWLFILPSLVSLWLTLWFMINKDSKLTCSPRLCIAIKSLPPTIECWHLMYTLIVRIQCTLYLFIVLNCVAPAVAAITAVYREWVSLAIVSTWTWYSEHLYCNGSDILFNFSWQMYWL